MRLKLLIILLAFGLQAHMLTQDIRFHPDEAFFMTFARNASVNGDWMLAGSLDKPPLSLYSGALSMMFIGVTTDASGVLQLDAKIGEFAGRFSNVVYAILLVALMMRLAHDFYRERMVTLLTGLLTATSPYILAFGATTFTDMSLLFWSTFAFWLTVSRRYGWAGFALGLACWSKQQAIFFLPIIVLMTLITLYKDKAYFSRAMRGVIAFIIILIALIIWDNARSETSIFILGTLNNTPDSLITSPLDYLPRLIEWGHLGAWLLGSPIVTAILVFITTVGFVIGLSKPNSQRTTDYILGLYVIGYLGLHTVLAFNQYDRYLLIILPMVIILCSRGLYHLMALTGEHRSRQYLQLVGVAMLLSTVVTISAPIPIGGDDGTHDGIDELADYLNSKPVATVIYDRWLGWELGYYMGQWTNKRRVHYPTPDALVAGALELDEIGDRYLVAPIHQPIDAWLDALDSAGFGITLDYQQDQFMVYRLSVPTSDA